MNNPAMLRRLIWKDVVTIKPLLLAAAIVVVVISLLLHSMYPEHHPSNGWSIPMWILIPGFVALGAPAMLVGTEEDNGTFGWLRTLPIRWQQISSSKLSVAAGAVLVTWGLSSIALWLISFGWRAPVGPEVLPLTGHGVLIIAFFMALLLLLGFVTSYSIRPPVVSLIVLVPIYATAALLCLNFARLASPGGEPALVVAGCGVLFVAWLLQWLLARRRLLLPVQSIASRVAATLPIADEYRPSTLPLRSRPSEVVSLLWQQIRQTGPLCIALVTVSTLSAILFTINRGETIFGGMAPLLIMLSASWLGAIVFYCDTLHRRCGFFADRGISPTRVWWTRMLPPAIAFLLLLGSISMIGFSLSSAQAGQKLDAIAMCAVLFAYGQLVSQWTQRPMLAFFAAPAYTFVSLAPVFYLLDRVGGAFAAIVLVVPVLLFASWRLTKFWLEGQLQRSYTARVIGYTALAVLLPCLWIGAQHLAPLSAYMIGHVVLETGITP